MLGDQAFSNIASGTNVSETEMERAEDIEERALGYLRKAYGNKPSYDFYANLYQSGPEDLAQQNYIRAALGNRTLLESQFSQVDRDLLFQLLVNQREFGEGGIEGYIFNKIIERPSDQSFRLSELSNLTQSSSSLFGNATKSEKTIISGMVDYFFPLSRHPKLQNVDLKSPDYYLLHLGAHAAMRANWNISSMEEDAIRAIGRSVLIASLIDRDFIFWMIKAVEFPAKLSHAIKTPTAREYTKIPNEIVSEFVKTILGENDKIDPVQTVRDLRDKYKSYEQFAKEALAEGIKLRQCHKDSSLRWALKDQRCLKPEGAKYSGGVHGTDLQINPIIPFKSQNEVLAKKIAEIDEIGLYLYFLNLPAVDRSMFENFDCMILKNVGPGLFSTPESNRSYIKTLTFLLLNNGSQQYIYALAITEQGYRTFHYIDVTGKDPFTYYTIAPYFGSPGTIRVRLVSTKKNHPRSNDLGELAKFIAEYHEGAIYEELNSAIPAEKSTVSDFVKRWLLPFYGCTPEGSSDPLGPANCAADISFFAFGPLAKLFNYSLRAGMIGLREAGKTLARLEGRQLTFALIRREGFEFLYRAKMNIEQFLDIGVMEDVLGSIAGTTYPVLWMLVTEHEKIWTTVRSIANALIKGGKLIVPKLSRSAMRSGTTALSELQSAFTQTMMQNSLRVDLEIFLTPRSKSSDDFTSLALKKGIFAIAGEKFGTDVNGYGVDIEGKIYTFIPARTDYSAGWIQGTRKNAEEFYVSWNGERFEFCGRYNTLSCATDSIIDTTSQTSTLEAYLDARIDAYDPEISSKTVLNQERGVHFIADKEAVADSNTPSLRTALSINGKFYKFNALDASFSEGIIFPATGDATSSFGNVAAYVRWNVDHYELIDGVDLIKIKSKTMMLDAIASYPTLGDISDDIKEMEIFFRAESEHPWCRIGNKAYPVRPNTGSPNEVVVFDPAGKKPDVILRNNFDLNIWAIDPGWIEDVVRTEWAATPITVERSSLQNSKNPCASGYREGTPLGVVSSNCIVPRSEAKLLRDIRIAKTFLLTTRNSLNAWFDAVSVDNARVADILCRIFFGERCSASRLKEIRSAITEIYKTISEIDVDKNIKIISDMKNNALGEFKFDRKLNPEFAKGEIIFEYSREAAGILLAGVGESEYLNAILIDLIHGGSMTAENYETRNARLNAGLIKHSLEKTPPVWASSVYAKQWSALDIASLPMLGRQYAAGAVDNPILNTDTIAQFLRLLLACQKNPDLVDQLSELNSRFEARLNDVLDRRVQHRNNILNREIARLKETDVDYEAKLARIALDKQLNTRNQALAIGVSENEIPGFLLQFDSISSGIEAKRSSLTLEDQLSLTLEHQVVQSIASYQENLLDISRKLSDTGVVEINIGKSRAPSTSPVLDNALKIGNKFYGFDVVNDDFTFGVLRKPKNTIDMNEKEIKIAVMYSKGRWRPIARRELFSDVFADESKSRYLARDRLEWVTLDRTTPSTPAEFDSANLDMTVKPYDENVRSQGWVDKIKGIHCVSSSDCATSGENFETAISIDGRLYKFTTLEGDFSVGFISTPDANTKSGLADLEIYVRWSRDRFKLMRGIALSNIESKTLLKRAIAGYQLNSEPTEFQRENGIFTLYQSNYLVRSSSGSGDEIKISDPKGVLPDVVVRLSDASDQPNLDPDWLMQVRKNEWGEIAEPQTRMQKSDDLGSCISSPENAGAGVLNRPKRAPCDYKSRKEADLKNDLAEAKRTVLAAKEQILSMLSGELPGDRGIISSLSVLLFGVSCDDEQLMRIRAMVEKTLEAVEVIDLSKNVNIVQRKGASAMGMAHSDRGLKHGPPGNNILLSFCMGASGIALGTLKEQAYKVARFTNLIHEASHVAAEFETLDHILNGVTERGRGRATTAGHFIMEKEFDISPLVFLGYQHRTGLIEVNPMLNADSRAFFVTLMLACKRDAKFLDKLAEKFTKFNIELNKEADKIVRANEKILNKDLSEIEKEIQKKGETPELQGRKDNNKRARNVNTREVAIATRYGEHPIPRFTIQGTDLDLSSFVDPHST
ncbi:hypothetical protein [Pararobbsia silviterrae]|uniref:hypothetical protein n=1 Tax=Pararobbsia silviterrae TaxID=1792498 RepID=UPI0011C3F672|nr:hypothetical protein [Pararobbsia silviterrae]